MSDAHPELIGAIKDLSIHFSGRPALSRVNLNLEAGALTVIVGRSGSGKSTLLRALNRLTTEQDTTMTRLATGKRINQASDDPAGLIALNTMNAEMAAINAALESNYRTQSMLDVADSTLTEVSSLVSEIEGLVLHVPSDQFSA